MAMWVSTLKNLRCCAVITGLSNVVVILIGAILIKLVYPDCGHKDILPFVVILLGCCIKIFIMIRTGIAQQATATMILNRPSQSAVLDAVIRHERRFLATTYLMLIVAKHVHQRGASSNCVLVFGNNLPNVLIRGVRGSDLDSLRIGLDLSASMQFGKRQPATARNAVCGLCG
ncbi:hypothetical protein HYC85_019682 [Camellia sinensis]|uniref:DUF7358 domain-containing protein n=1 Tax=Camellia sinensis TaxID=4442 RepID=A0A7J7GMV6_CAMSI|nr:hypothetical protein HYC85_019682 [Camellia sinensis]